MQNEKKFLSELEKKWPCLKKQARPISFRKGQVLFYEGHSPYGLFLLLKGELRFLHHGKTCSEKHYWNFQDTQILCLKSFLKNSSYTCHAYLLSDADFLFLSKTEFLSEE